MADYYNVKFKGERKVCYIDENSSHYQVGDFVMVEAEKGEDLGVVAQKRLQEPPEEDRRDMKRIRRRALPEEAKRLEGNRDKEKNAFTLCEQKIHDHNLAMKLVDVEFQYDANKITFFFTAEKRIDFRSLVKDLASTYNTRIELRQIGVRDEARRIGGYGHCGVALCCSTFKEEFEPVTTKMARDQLLSVNPRKLSGACGRLMCCLEYEYTFYKGELEQYPPIGAKIHTTRGEAFVDTIDVFKQQVTVKFGDNPFEVLSCDALKAIWTHTEKLHEPGANGTPAPAVPPPSAPLPARTEPAVSVQPQAPLPATVPPPTAPEPAPVPQSGETAHG